MSINLSIKNASDEVVAALKLRAKRNHRSLQGELMAIIEAAAATSSEGLGVSGFEDVARPGWKTGGREAATQEEMRRQNVERATRLMGEGLRLGGRRFTRDEMHER